MPGQPLTEAALVTELKALMHANRPPGCIILEEQLYSLLLPSDATRQILKGKVEADLVVANESVPKPNEGEMTPHLEIIIEAKRARERWERISKDLQRLYEALTIAKKPTLRGWLFVISESHLPEKFVTEKGKSRQEPVAIEGTDEKGWYVVRRSCKASSRFETTREAHYACLIEVLTYKPTKRELRTRPR
jgi:hypothetical protein